MSTVQIQHKTGRVLFECEQADEMPLRNALEKGVQARANLHEADLHEADLHGADLRESDLCEANLRETDLHGADLYGADLRGADLYGADLRGANLRETDLHGADLHGANLRGANLRGADLHGADLRGANLRGERPFFTIGPIGSRGDYVHVWITDKGLMIRTGCFFGNREEFVANLTKTHGDSLHGQEYRAALVLCDKHAELWTPQPEEATGGLT